MFGSALLGQWWRITSRFDVALCFLNLPNIAIRRFFFVWRIRSIIFRSKMAGKFWVTPGYRAVEQRLRWVGRWWGTNLSIDAAADDDVRIRGVELEAENVIGSLQHGLFNTRSQALSLAPGLHIQRCMSLGTSLYFGATQCIIFIPDY